MRLGEVVRVKRHSQNLSMRDLALMSQVSLSTINRIENSKSRPTFSILKSVAYALDTTAQEIIDEADDM